ncbi:hypothetical protein [Erythrobacter litoralis]|uniref:Uncharacterized protein n=1 Tax=Erythrobacter litoralis (strain HTCC2594) TaxID=314225 RepID=Q2N945_ERYLH|nr:hypothetical protein [Erythrobacter litoralis]ABC63796.1 hypothetical protein ELI_08520 [Erythrobacter litoralis HTCC2594]
MRAVLIILATAAIGLVAGYAISRFAGSRRKFAQWSAIVAPVLIYTAFYLATPKPEHGTAVQWYMIGLMFVSPVLIPWMACVPVEFRLGRRSTEAGAAVTDPR